MSLEQIGIIINLLGSLAMAKGLFVSARQARELGIARWSGTDEENMKLPNVRDRLDQRSWATIGAILMIIGAAIQLL